MIVLSGDVLTPAAVYEAARPGARVKLAPEGLDRMAKARHLIDVAVNEGRPVYGVTTGLGSRATESLSMNQLADFSVETLNGRAQSVGEPLAPTSVRAAMTVRLNTFMIGASGAHPDIARHLAAVFNAGLTPDVRATGSIGAADLLLGAEIGRAVMGLGGTLNGAPAAETLRDKAFSPPPLGPRDGLALANHSSFSAAEAALAVVEAGHCLAAAPRVLALSFLGFQANVTPLDPSVLALRKHPGDARVASVLLSYLEGAKITDPSAARRLQDPISLRNAIQSLGAADSLIDRSRATVTVELNGSSDNPAVLAEEDRIVSTGNYFTPHLTLACDGATRALSGVGAMILARLSKLCAERFTGLPAYLADPEAGTNGFAPLLKLAEALLADLHHAATPTAPWPSVNADGVEDGLTLSFQAARRLRLAARRGASLLALEAMMAVQAMDLRGVAPTDRLRDTYDQIREVSPYLGASRPLGRELETLADQILSGELGAQSS